MNDTAYRLLVGTLDAFLWGGELVGEQDLPERGPAVFVANHLGSLGPIAVTCSLLPRRLYHWVIEDTIHPQKAPDYLRVDFVEPELGLKPPLSLYAATAIAKISVPLLRSLGGIAVPHDFEGIQETLRASIALLREGKFLLIFPEDPKQPPDPATKMRPFKKGFARLGELFFEATGGRLEFYPLAVHPTRKVSAANPVVYQPLNPPVTERLRIKNLLEASIRRMVLEITMEEYTGVPLPR